MSTIGTRDQAHRIFCLQARGRLDDAISRNTAQSYLDALQAEVKFIDWTLPPPGPVTDASVAQIRAHCALIAARAFQLAEEITARPRAAPMKPVPSATDALLHPAAEGETDHAD